MVLRGLSGNVVVALLFVAAFSADALWARDDGRRGSGSNSGGQSSNRGGGNSGSRNFSGGNSSSRNPGGGGSSSARNFSGGNTGGGSSRNLSGGGGSSRTVAPRTFDAPKVDTRQFTPRDVAPRVQTQPRQRVDTFRAPSVENRGTAGGRDSSKFNKPNDSPRFDASKGGQSDRAAEAILRAQQQLKTRDLGSSNRVRTDKPLEGPKFDRPNLDKPDFDKPNLGNSRRDSLDRIKRPGDLPNNNLPNGGNNNLTRDGRNGSKFERVPGDARDTLDRGNRNPDLKKDLNLGNKFNKPDGGRITTDLDKMGLDRGKFDRGGNADRGRPDRDKFEPGRNPSRDFGSKDGPNFNRGGAGKNFAVDKDKRERYDSLHHRIKHDPTRGIDNVTAAKLSRQNWQEKSDRRHYDQLAKHDKFRNINLDKQYRMHDRGDISRRMDLHRNLRDRGGWQNRNVGFVSAHYRNHCSYRNYWGPSWYPRRCWYPVWNSWVSWSWGFNCNPWYDPRPIFCRPVIYDPCPRWVVWQYPVWQPLPVVAAGTWVDVPQVAVAQGWDVRLLAARFVDPGHLEQGLGQRYRVWIRNDSETDVNQPFNVVLMGTNDLVPGDRRLEIGQRVPSIEAGQTIALDLRLPLSPEGAEPMPFEKLHVLVDANRELNDIEMTNNGAVIDRGEVMPVDPASFNVDTDIANSGDVITIAGEGLGPEAGQVLLQVGNETYQPEILGWYDLGVQVRVPDVVADGLTTGDLVIVRGDGAAANPLTLQIAGAASGRAF